MNLKNKKKSKFKVVGVSGVSNKHGSFGGGSLQFNKPITQRLNVNVSQGVSYSKPKDKGIRIKGGDTTFGFEKKFKGNKSITGFLTGNVKNKKVTAAGIKFTKRF
tara:strand:- start:185 stop:499 length:315 start_codon:yes stop_codon:yes gene_type:complete